MDLELSIYFEEVSYIYDRESIGHLRHIISWCHIALHDILRSCELCASLMFGHYVTFDYPYMMKSWLISIMWTCKIKELFSYILLSLLLRYWSMKYTGFTWFHTHTTRVALSMVHIQFRIGAHREEQFESEFGVSWSCGERLGCSVARTPLYLLLILLFTGMISLMLDLSF